MQLLKQALTACESGRQREIAVSIIIPRVAHTVSSNSVFAPSSAPPVGIRHRRRCRTCQSLQCGATAKLVSDLEDAPVDERIELELGRDGCVDAIVWVQAVLICLDGVDELLGCRVACHLEVDHH